MQSATPADAYQSVFRYLDEAPLAAGTLKRRCEDFCVLEELGFEPEGSGEHIFLQIQKTDQHTADLAQRIARIAQVRPADIGYCGLKDKRALTTQWFSVYLPGSKTPDWSQLEDENTRVVQQTWHRKKLRRGIHRYNHFEIVIADIDWSSQSGDGQVLPSEDVGGSKAIIEGRLEKIGGGVPNYFGEQRFGWHRGNVEKAAALFEGSLKVKKRDKRGLYISAARSFLFNELLSQRIAEGHWHTRLDGDVLMLDGSHSVFSADADDAEIAQRLVTGDLHITGPMWGAGRGLVTAAAFEFERQTIGQYPHLASGLEAAGLKQSRRALRVIPEQLKWSWQVGEGGGDSLQLAFSLPPGCFATSILREIVNVAAAP